MKPRLSLLAPAGQRGWILCRNLKEFPVPDNVVLQRWAERGLVRPDDYLVNPGLDACVQAKEIAQLVVIFRKATVRRLEKMSWLFVLGAFAIGCIGLIAR